MKWGNTKSNHFSFKNIIELLGENNSDDPIPIKTFVRFWKLQIGKNHEDFDFVTNNVLLDRQIKNIIECKKSKRMRSEML